MDLSPALAAAHAAKTTTEQRLAQAHELIQSIPTAHREHVKYRFGHVKPCWKLRWARAVAGKAGMAACVQTFCAECLGYETPAENCDIHACPLYHWRAGKRHR